MSVREAAEALLAYMDIDSGALNHHDRMEALREALAEPEPVTVDALLEAMRGSTLIVNGPNNWALHTHSGLFDGDSMAGSSDVERIMRVLREQASGAGEDGE